MPGGLYVWLQHRLPNLRQTVILSISGSACVCVCVISTACQAVCGSAHPFAAIIWHKTETSITAQAPVVPLFLKGGIVLLLEEHRELQQGQVFVAEIAEGPFTLCGKVAQVYFHMAGHWVSYTCIISHLWTKRGCPVSPFTLTEVCFRA